MIKESTDEAVRGSPAFIRVLTTSLIKHVTSQTRFANGPKNPLEPSRDLYQKQEELIRSVVKPVLSKFLGEEADEARKLEVLYACQRYCADVGFPKELLEHLFRLLYDQEIVEEGVYWSWKGDEASGREKASKKEAIKQTAGWFKSLQQEE
ncbi:Eukaryotic translation initiation factor 4 gamma 2 [Quaeritorhiza haematococci]|nr:Eukaryotic translation initiation factor 4 gamma 2 [Quaeritorhiza haematococci]